MRRDRERDRDDRAGSPAKWGHDLYEKTEHEGEGVCLTVNPCLFDVDPSAVLFSWLSLLWGLR